MSKLEGWAKEYKVQEFEKAKKGKRRVFTQAIICIIVGLATFLYGWWLVGIYAFLIAIGFSLFLFGAFAFYGQIISEVSISSENGNKGPRKN